MLPLGSSLEQGHRCCCDRETQAFKWMFHTVPDFRAGQHFTILCFQNIFFPPKEIRKFTLPKFLTLPLLTCSDLGDYSHKPYLCLAGVHPRFPLGTGATQFLKQLFQTINKFRYRQLMSTTSFPNFHKLWNKYFILDIPYQKRLVARSTILQRDGGKYTYIKENI